MVVKLFGLTKRFALIYNHSKETMLRLMCQRALCNPCRKVSARCMGTDTTAAPSVSNLAQNQEDILQEASALTRSLYRLCMRSVKLIRQGNEHDAAEFASREEKQMQDMMESSENGNEHLSGVVSMLPPVQPEAELQSRSEYYAQYTNENFFAESDCLRVAEGQEGPDESQFARYFYHLRKGEEHRTWLLQDMKFTDVYRFDLARVDRLEERVKELLEEQRRIQWEKMDPKQKLDAQQAQKDYEEYNSEDEAFSDDEEEEEDDKDIPIHYKNKNRRFIEDEE